MQFEDPGSYSSKVFSHLASRGDREPQLDALPIALSFMNSEGWHRKLEKCPSKEPATSWRANGNFLEDKGDSPSFSISLHFLNPFPALSSELIHEHWVFSWCFANLWPITSIWQSK